MATEKLIQDYLNGQLTGEDLKKFETDMQHNPDLASDIALAKQMRQLAERHEKQAFRDMMRGIALENPIEPDFTPIGTDAATTPPRRTFWQAWQTWAIVGAVVLLGIVAANFLGQQLQSQTEARLQNISKDYWDFPVAVTKDATNQTPFAVGMRHFEQKEYSQAAASLEQHLKTATEEDAVAQLYLGISYALSHERIKAIALLKSLAEQKNAATATSAQWFVALCYLNQGDETNARRWLEPLIADATFGSRAREIIEKLDAPK